ncbi:MAG TPA: DUF2946 domain-containing protein [Burkholderiales bacterium]
MSASRHLRTGSLAAILAVLLNALWPLFAHAKPSDSLTVPVCTVGGETHYIEIERGDSPLDKRSQAQHEHCKLCVFAAERTSLPPMQFPVLTVPALPDARPAAQSEVLSAAPSIRPAQSRAPPAAS